MAKRLRSGFTTGACSAAAAKAGCLALKNTTCPTEVTITFPDGSQKCFPVHSCKVLGDSAQASIIKDAGDDPDVTNGAEIVATVRKGHISDAGPDSVTMQNILLCRGEGVGRITKPGLAIAVGQLAINPVPREMILRAVQDITGEEISVTISVTGGEQLAEKTLNSRLGIVGGLSILGTTGIVRPVSADAWTATIQASLDVAKEAGLQDIVLSTGRTSEKGAQQRLHLPIEAYAMMGDYLEFSLLECKKRNFATIHLAGMWAKIMKAALRIPQTHVRNGALEISQGADLLEQLGASGDLLEKIKRSNTAREMLTHLQRYKKPEIIEAVCRKAKEYGQDVSGRKVVVYLIDHKASVLCHV